MENLPSRRRLRSRVKAHLSPALLRSYREAKVLLKRGTRALPGRAKVELPHLPSKTYTLPGKHVFFGYYDVHLLVAMSFLPQVGANVQICLQADPK